MCLWLSERDKQQDISVTTNTTVLESERHLQMKHCRPARETPETQMTKNKRQNDWQARRNYQETDKKIKKIIAKMVSITNSSLYILYRPNVL